MSDGRPIKEEDKKVAAPPQPPLSKKQAKRLAKREAIAVSAPSCSVTRRVNVRVTFFILLFLIDCWSCAVVVILEG